MSHFNQPNIERNNCVWTTKYKKLMEMCIVQHVATKSVFTIQPIKWLVSTTVKIQSLLSGFDYSLSGPKTDIYVVWRWRFTQFCKEDESRLQKRTRNFYANQFQANPNLNQERLKWVQIWNKRILFLLVDDLSNIFVFQVILFNFNLQSTTQLTVNLQKIIIFSVSNDGIQWTLDFGPDSVTIAVNDLVQNTTTSSQEIPVAAWQLLLSQGQDFLDNHLPWVLVTENQDGTLEMRDEVLSSVGAQDLDTSSYQVSDLEDIEFNWKNSQLDMDAVFRPGIDTPFSPTTFDDLSMEWSSNENSIVLDEEEN